MYDEARSAVPTAFYCGEWIDKPTGPKGECEKAGPGCAFACPARFCFFHKSAGLGKAQAGRLLGSRRKKGEEGKGEEEGEWEQSFK